MNIIFTHLPPIPGISSEIYAGKPIVTSGFIDALTKKSPSFKIIVYTPKSQYYKYFNFRKGYRFPDRIELLDAQEIKECIPMDGPTVILTLETSLRNGIHLRFLCGSKPWPVIGMTHDLSSVEVYTNLLLTHIGKPNPYDAIICSSKCAQGVLKKLLGVTGAVLGRESKFELPIIPLGIDLTLFGEHSAKITEINKNFFKNEPVFLCLGRLSYTMKADLLPLIRSFAKISKIFPSHLIIAGSVIPPDEESVLRIEKIISELDLNDQITIYTNVSEKQQKELMAIADIFISVPDSLQESFGLVLLEAMAMGLPIIASDWNGYREIIDNGKSGLLIETMMPGDGLDGISKGMIFEDRWWWYGEFSQTVILNHRQLELAMLALLENPDLRQNMGIAGRNRIQKNFDWNQLIELYHTEWKRLLELTKNFPSHNPCSEYWYSHSEVFVDHPSRFFDSNSKVKTVLNNGINNLEIESPPPFLSTETLNRILKELEKGTQICDLPLTGLDANRYIAYLLKHGLIEIVNE